MELNNSHIGKKVSLEYCGKYYDESFEEFQVGDYVVPILSKIPFSFYSNATRYSTKLKEKVYKVKKSDKWEDHGKMFNFLGLDDVPYDHPFDIFRKATQQEINDYLGMDKIIQVDSDMLEVLEIAKKKYPVGTKFNQRGAFNDKDCEIRMNNHYIGSTRDKTIMVLADRKSGVVKDAISCIYCNGVWAEIITEVPESSETKEEWIPKIGDYIVILQAITKSLIGKCLPIITVENSKLYVAGSKAFTLPNCIKEGYIRKAEPHEIPNSKIEESIESDTYPNMSFSPGDKVKVLRKAKSHERGWQDDWVSEMDSSVSQILEVKHTRGREGVLLSDNYWYPNFVLEKVTKSKEFPLIEDSDFKLGDSETNDDGYYRVDTSMY